jgi:hypothetical protein
MISTEKLYGKLWVTAFLLFLGKYFCLRGAAGQEFSENFSKNGRRGRK